MRKSSILVVLIASAFASSAHAHALNPTEEKTEEVTTTLDPISKVSRKFKDSIFLFDQSVTPDTLNAKDQLSPVPSYQWWLSLRPRYNFTPRLSLRARIDLTVEWLNAADTTHKREGQWGDIWLDVVYSLPSRYGIIATVGGRVILPTSLEAQAATTVMKVGPVLGLARPFEGTKVGDFDLRLGIYGLYNFVQQTTPKVLVTYACAGTDFGPTTCGSVTSSQDTQFTLVAAVSGRYTPKWLPKLSLGVSYIISDSFAYGNPDANLPEGGGLVPRSPNDTRFRQSSWFLASLDYDVKDWLSLSFGYYCLRPILDQNSSYGNPFYMPGGAARVFITTTFTLDKVYEAVARRVKKNSTAAKLAPVPKGAQLSWNHF
jgi:hypothetical protein